MQSAPSAPTPPDPAATNAAQTQSNKDTALYTAGLNDVNQNTPLGSLNYNINPTGNGGTGATYNNDAYNQAMTAWQAAQNAPQSSSQGMYAGGYNPLTGQIGQYGNSSSNAGPMPQLSQYQTSAGTGATPSVTSNVTLNPQVQDILNQTLTGSQSEANLANTYMANAQKTLAQPYNLNSIQAPTPDAGYQKKIMDNMNALQQPYVARSNEQLDASLANQGITQGSQAYQNAKYDQNSALNNMQQQNIQNATQQEQSQYGMANTAYQQALQNYTQQYNQPLNEVNALRSGSQVSMPQFSTAPNIPVANTNVSGNINQGYQNNLGLYNSQVGQNNSTMSGLFGLGGSLGAAALPSIIASDRRLKQNIVFIGETIGGHKIYAYNYKWSDKPEIGVMAHEAVKVTPAAVVMMPNGYAAVNYGMIH